MISDSTGVTVDEDEFVYVCSYMSGNVVIL